VRRAARLVGAEIGGGRAGVRVDAEGRDRLAGRARGQTQELGRVRRDEPSVPLEDDDPRRVVREQPVEQAGLGAALGVPVERRARQGQATERGQRRVRGHEGQP
jgi:hypothetical protein